MDHGFLSDDGSLGSLSSSASKKAISQASTKKRGQRASRGQGSHLCRVCGKKYSSKQSMTRHIRELHESNPAQPNYVCHFCSAGFIRKGDRTRHIKKLHKSDRSRQNHICRFCGGGFIRLQDVVKHMEFTHGFKGQQKLPLVAHRTCLVVEEENVYDEPPRSLRSKVTRQTDILDLTAIQGKVTGQTDILDLTATDCCLEPALSSMESVKRVRRPPQSLGSSLAMLADNPRFALKHARSKPQTLRSSNPEDPSNISPSAILQAASNSSPPKSPERVTRKLSMEARFPKSKRAKPQTSTPERFPQAPELHRTAPEESVIVSLSSDSEPQASTPKLLCSKNIKFHFFLANEQHGAILKSLEKCNTMSSFFDEAQEAWDASGEEQHQARMTAVKVIIEDVSRPMFILWRDQEGYEGMMDAIQEQAAGRPKSLNVEIRCHFKRG